MTFQNETLQIHTPENVIFDYQIAGIGSRFLACILDTLLIILIQMFVNFITLLVVREIGWELQSEASRWIIALLSLLSFAVFWGYYIFFETTWNGQTPGKRRNNLRVIRRAGTPITLSEAVIRNLVRLVDFLPGLYTVGIVTMFIDSQARRLGDLAAGTLVVHDRQAIALSSLEASAGSKQRWNDPAQPVEEGGLPLYRLSAQDLTLVEEFLHRRYQLSNREAMADRLAQHVYSRMGLVLPLLPIGEAEKRLSQLLHDARHSQGAP